MSSSPSPRAEHHRSAVIGTVSGPSVTWLKHARLTIHCDFEDSSAEAMTADTRSVNPGGRRDDPPGGPSGDMAGDMELYLRRGETCF